MSRRLKLMRENAKAPEQKGGAKKSNWMDVYASAIAVLPNGSTLEEDLDSLKPEDFQTEGPVEYDIDDVLVIKLGFAMELHEGEEGYILPRSGTFKKYGLLLTNSQGVVDTSYCGDNDEWTMQMYSTRPGVINIGDRPGQIRIQQSMTDSQSSEFEIVDVLGNPDRGGYGSTGR